MGFGIALLGYAFLILHEVGGGILAAPLLAYGFFLASRLERRFLNASVSALFMFPRGIIQLLSVLGVFDIGTLATLNTVTFILNLAAWLLMSYFWLSAVMSIAKDCNSPKLEQKARNRLVFTVSFIVFALSAGILNLTGALGGIAFPITAIQYILQYTVIIVNTLFLHTCFILITSERQYEKDKQEIAKENAKALEKRYKNQEAKRNGRRK